MSYGSLVRLPAIKRLQSMLAANASVVAFRSNPEIEFDTLSPFVQATSAYYRRKVGRHAMPRRDELVLAEMLDLLPNVVVFEVTDPLDFVVEHIGTTLKQYSQLDRIGQVLGQCRGIGFGTPAWRHFYEVVCAKEPVFDPPPLLEPGLIAADGASFPFTTDGRTVSHILTVIDIASPEL